MLTTFDKALLNELQKDFPVEAHPFAISAQRRGSDEDAVLQRLASRWAADDRVVVLVDSLTVQLRRA